MMLTDTTTSLSSARLSILKVNVNDEASLSNQELETLEDKIKQKIKDRGRIDQLFVTKAVGKNKNIPVPRAKLNIITTISTLKVLSLRKCNLTSLPKNIVDLKKLKYLSLSHNKFRQWSSLASISQLINLETLILDNNELVVPPEFQIFTLSKLRVLNLSNNRLKYLPTEITTLKELKDLYIDGNLLEHIPKQLLCLEESLKRISLARNPFTDKEARICEKGNVKRIMKYLKHQKAQVSSKDIIIKKKVGGTEINIKRDEFDDPKYVDRFNTGGLLRRAYLTFSIDLRRYTNQFLPPTIHLHKDIIQTCVVNIDQVKINVGANCYKMDIKNKNYVIDEDELENQISCSPAIKFILSLRNLNLLVVTYTKKKKDQFNRMKRLTRVQNMLKLNFYVVNSVEEVVNKMHDTTIGSSVYCSDSVTNYANQAADYCCKFVVFPLRMQITENNGVQVTNKKIK
jgi:hypothetical protein